MAGLIPIGNIEAAADLTTAHLVRTATQTQKEVDARIAPVAADIIANDPDVVAAAAQVALEAEGIVTSTGPDQSVLEWESENGRVFGRFVADPVSGRAAPDADTREWWGIPGPDDYPAVTDDASRALVLTDEQGREFARWEPLDSGMGVRLADSAKAIMGGIITSSTDPSSHVPAGVRFYWHDTASNQLHYMEGDAS